jgi:hypothetical protein
MNPIVVLVVPTLVVPPVGMPIVKISNIYMLELSADHVRGPFEKFVD